MTSSPRFVLPASWLRAALALFLLGLVAAALGIAWSPRRTWSNLLLVEAYVLGLAVAGAVFICIQHLSGAGWSAVLRRVPEAMMGPLPAFALLALLLFAGRPVLFAGAQENVGPAKALFLSTPFVLARTALILAVLVLLARALRRLSLRQDEKGDLAAHRRLVRTSAVFMVVFAVALTLASVDWLMALEPEWTSTIFSVYVFAGLLVSGLAALTLIVVLLQWRGDLRGLVGPDHLHDLGKLIFTFTTFWAYIWLSQYLLIWYADLPEEVTHYARRTQGPWTLPFLLNLLVNWVIPFLVLLPRAAKRSARVLAGVSLLLLAGRWLDLYLLIMPETMGTPLLGPLEVLLPLGFAALFAFLTARALAQAPLLPLGDPYLAESLQHHP